MKVSSGNLVLKRPDEQVENSERRKKHVQNVQKLMDHEYMSDHRWDSMVRDALNAIAKSENSDTFWPRDTMFKYLQLMENFMENLQEYQELSLLARKHLLELHDL